MEAIINQNTNFNEANIKTNANSCQDNATTSNNHMNIRVAMLGNVDSGKSTTTAVLISKPGELDDGRGNMRKQVFNFQHEINNGRTSSIGHEIMGFNKGVQYVTKFDHSTKKNKIWPDIVENSDKIIHLLDMCGHEKYLKTTMHGLTSNYPDYAMITIGANMGISRLTKEHIGIAMALDIPVFIVMTKIDLAPNQILAENTKKIVEILKTHCGKVPTIIKENKDVDKVASIMKNGKVAPIFYISNHTGDGVDMLKTFFGKLERNQNKMNRGNVVTHQDITTQFVIDDTYHSKGLGLILCGTVLKGKIELNQTMMFGPDKNGNFKTLKIKDIHQNRVPITEATQGNQITLKVKQVGKNELQITQAQIRKGSFLINQIDQKVKGVNPYHQVCSKYFIAKIKVRNHHTTIQPKYSAVMHMGGIRQTAQVIHIKNKDCMRIGDTDEVLFRLQYGVEIINKGEKLMLREGATRAIGFVTETFPFSTPAEDILAQFIQ